MKKEEVVESGKKTYMYIGTYYYTLEAKNRVSLPASLRKMTGNEVVVTRGLDGCLFVFDLENWHKTVDAIEDLSFTKQRNRDFVRLLTNNAQQVEIDDQGRILLAEHLKTSAHLEKEIVIVGSMDRIEIWNKETYHTYSKRIETEAENIAEGIELPAMKNA
jgi:MraZ protein